MSKQHYTDGPWEWRQVGARLMLCTPDRGLLIVLDCVRSGMEGAEPRFATWEAERRERMGGLMRPASELNLDEHPDARLIAAAPDLAAALQGLGGHPEYDYCFCLNREQIEAGHTGECRQARSALVKAGIMEAS